MIDIQSIPLHKQVYCFELDDVLYPRQDYILQVYYLFAQFVEFSDGTPGAADLVDFMKNAYLHQGEKQVFGLAQQTFGFSPLYEENLRRLQANAQLPLKLILFAEVEDFLSELFAKEKKIAILTKGNPIEQLNKLKYIEWGRLEPNKNSLKVYFVDELVYRSIEPLNFVAGDFGVTRGDVHVIVE